ncbi:undecaprenyldiphospho-muramoylpentapeptide beta-N-acetylglucosaminyltransferase [Candidatus Neomarinimicrobiota bacterium]
MDKSPNIIIAGGGTGGHLFPAIAIGEALHARLPQAKIHYLGSIFGIEADVLPVKGLPHSLLPIRGFQRGISLKAIFRNLLLPFRIMKSMKQTRKIFNEFSPNLVIGTGGYASAIPLKIANKSNIPTIIQEQNSFPGITTRMFHEKAQCTFIAFPEAKQFLQTDRSIVTGNPTRKGIQNGDRNQAAQHFKLDPKKKTVFLFGGSQGSLALNEIMKDAFQSLVKSDIQVIWQTGPWEYKKLKKHKSDSVRVYSFINHMEEAYAISDIVISRAGAITLSEITVCGKPSIIVPFPQAAADHQTKNAEALSKADAAIMISQKDLNSNNLVKTISELLQDKKRLQSMSEKSKAIGKPEATEVIVENILKVIQA